MLALLTFVAQTDAVSSVRILLGSCVSLMLACSERADPLDELPEPTPTPAEVAQEPEQPADPGPQQTAVAGARVRVLGTAQDGGLPHAACSCEFCEAARHDASRARLVASLGVIAPESGKAFLIDATPDIHEQLDALADIGKPGAGRVDREPVDGILLTHAHIGHYLGLALLGFEAVHTTQMPVWTSEKMDQFLRTNAPWEQLVRIENISLRRFSTEAPEPLADGITVQALAVPHRDEYADTHGFVIKGPRASLLYVPDSAPWSAWEVPLPKVIEEHGVTVAVLDATFYSADELPGRDLSALAHPLMTDTMELLQGLVESGQVSVYFTHFNHSNPVLDPSGPTRTQTLRRGFLIAEDGLELPL
jgi:pyrroloquinoline quinone biosynthesis protein B